jgi:hypothetical protein
MKMQKKYNAKNLTRREIIIKVGLLLGATTSLSSVANACDNIPTTVVKTTNQIVTKTLPPYAETSTVTVTAQPTTLVTTLPVVTIPITNSPPTVTTTLPSSTITMPQVTITQQTTVSPPMPTGAMSLAQALRLRKSANELQSKDLPTNKLLELLWAAWGINRVNGSLRTAPSAINAQEIDIYVLLAEGAYLYLAKENTLSLIVTLDLRDKAMTLDSVKVKNAPVHLLFVADYAKLGNMAQSTKQLYSAAHTGFIGQNIYLFCAAEGLGTRFHTQIDRVGLHDILKMRPEQAIIFAQVVGYFAT